MCYYNVICNYYVFMGATARKWLAVKTTSLWSSHFSRLVEFHPFWLFFQELSCQLKKKRVNNFHEADRSDAKPNIPAYYPLAALTPNLNRTLIS